MTVALTRSLLLLSFLLVSGPVQTTAVAADTNEEAVVWNSIKDTNNVNVLKAFIKSYPNGTFTAIATSLIGVLEAKTANPTVTGTATDQETALWNSVKTAKTPADLQPYLDAYPNGAYAALVRSRMINLIAAEVVPEGPSEPATETSTLVVPEKEINPFDGQWRVSGVAHSFKRFQGGICKNPDSLNGRLVVKNGEVDAVLQSKSNGKVRIQGELRSSGQLELNFDSPNQGYNYTGSAKLKLKQDASRISLQVKLRDPSQSGCHYKFSIRRVQY